MRPARQNKLLLDTGLNFTLTGGTGTVVFVPAGLARPMAGSLNVATAAAIVLHAMATGFLALRPAPDDPIFGWSTLIRPK